MDKMRDSRFQRRSALMSLTQIATILAVGEQLHLGCALIDKGTLTNNKMSRMTMTHGLRRRRLGPILDDHRISSGESTIPQHYHRHALRVSTGQVLYNRELEKIRQINVPPTVPLPLANEMLNATDVVWNMTDVFNSTNSTEIKDNIMDGIADNIDGDQKDPVDPGAPGDIQDFNRTNVTAIKEDIIDGTPYQLDAGKKDPVNTDAPGDINDAEDPGAGATNVRNNLHIFLCLKNCPHSIPWRSPC
jgi:hypothetical protein